MKLNEISHAVEANVQSTEMRILQSSKMFEMLAALYSDQAKAIWRELIANAHDASPTRMKISLPSAALPAVMIRDFGPGMSHEFMMGGYTWVGHSTKADTNDQIGGFGLGRLAPIAYEHAKTYTVTSIHEGVKRVYVVYRNEKGVPAVALTHEEPTNEESGCEIMVPVAHQDYRLFSDRLQEVLKWFPPDCYEVFGTKIEPVKVNIRHSTYLEVADLKQNWILMGPIAYQVDWGKIGKSLPTSIVPIFNVGDLDLPPSRETVAYGPNTVAALGRRYNDIAADLPGRAVKEAEAMTPAQRLGLVESLSSSQGMRVLFADYHQQMGHRQVDDDAGKAFLGANGSYVGFEKTWGVYLRREHEVFEIKGNMKIFDRPSYRAMSNGRRVEKTGRDISTFPIRNPMAFQNYHFFYFDVTDKHPRIADRLQESGVVPSQGFVVVYDEDTWDVIKANFDSKFLHKLSEFTPPIKVRGVTRMRHYVKQPGVRSFDNVDSSLPTDGIFVYFDGTNPDYSHASAECQSHDWLFDEWVYGLHKTARSKVDLDDFISADQFLINKGKDLLSQPDFITGLKARKTLNALRDHPLARFIEPRITAGMTDIMPKICAKYLELVELNNKYSDKDYKGLYNVPGLSVPEIKPDPKVIALFDKAAANNKTLMFMMGVWDGSIRKPFTNPDTQSILQQLVK